VSNDVTLFVWRDPEQLSVTRHAPSYSRGQDWKPRTMRAFIHTRRTRTRETVGDRNRHRRRCRRAMGYISSSSRSAGSPDWLCGSKSQGDRALFEFCAAGWMQGWAFHHYRYEAHCIPNLGGRWSGNLRSSHDKMGRSTLARIVIRQTWDPNRNRSDYGNSRRKSRCRRLVNGADDALLVTV